MRRIPLPTLLMAGIVVLVLLVYALTFVVRFSQVAVKVRLGEVAAPRWAPSSATSSACRTSTPSSTSSSWAAS
jgi:hypothetical protein